jgi:hypothetical protein
MDNLPFIVDFPAIATFDDMFRPQEIPLIISIRLLMVKSHKTKGLKDYQHYDRLKSHYYMVNSCEIPLFNTIDVHRRVPSPWFFGHPPGRGKVASRRRGLLHWEYGMAHCAGGEWGFKHQKIETEAANSWVFLSTILLGIKLGIFYDYLCIRILGLPLKRTFSEG